MRSARARRVFVLGVLLVLGAFVALGAGAPAARASTAVSITTANGATVCPTDLGAGISTATWDGATNTCTVTSGLRVLSGTTLEVGTGVEIIVDGYDGGGASYDDGGHGVYNAGTINNHGSIIANGGNAADVSDGAGGATGGSGIYNDAGGTINNYYGMYGTGGLGGYGGFGTLGELDGNGGTGGTGGAGGNGVSNLGTINNYYGTVQGTGTKAGYGGGGGTGGPGIPCSDPYLCPHDGPSNDTGYAKPGWGGDGGTGGNGGHGIYNANAFNNHHEVIGTGGNGNGGGTGGYGTTQGGNGGNGGNGGSGIYNTGAFNNDEDGTILVAGGDQGTGSDVGNYRGGPGPYPETATFSGGASDGVDGNGGDGILNPGTFSNQNDLDISGSYGLSTNFYDSLDLRNSGAFNNYCGATLTMLFSSGNDPVDVACHPVTFQQNGIPAGTTWGVSVGWGPFSLFPVDHTGTGASLTINAVGSLQYTYDSTVSGSGGASYVCSTECSASTAISGPATFSAGYQAFATTVTCDSPFADQGASTTCTASVAGASPTGTVTFISSSGGSFTPYSAECTLSPSGSCSVTYINYSLGTATITASYSGDPANPPSSGTFDLLVAQVISITTANGNTVCQNWPLMGAWTAATNTCAWSSGFSLPSYQALVIGTGVTLNASGGGVGFSNSGAVFNYGTLTGSGGGSFGVGIRNGSAGTIHNAGTLSGFTTGSDSGIYNSGVINNAATMTGTATGANSSGITNASATINNAGTITGDGVHSDIANPGGVPGGIINNYCGGTLVGGLFGLGTVNAIPCYSVTFNQSGLPAGTTWGATAAWSPRSGVYFPAVYRTTNGASIPVQLIGSLSYSFDASVMDSGHDYLCKSDCSGSATVASAENLAVTYAYPATTFIDCADPLVGPGLPTDCRVWIGGNAPTGTVTFTSSTPGIFSPASGQCEIVTSGPFTGSCVVAFSTNTLGVTTLTASYPGDPYNQPTSGTFSLTVKAITTVAVSCSPSPLGFGGTTTCTAAVTGVSPTGTVTFNYFGSGALFSPGECTLASGSCSVNFTDDTLGSTLGATTISADYTGDAYNQYSAGAVPLTLAPPTTTAVSCSPSSVDPGSSTTCTATVTGTSPTGTVTFTSDSLTGSFDPTSSECTLVSGACSVDYSDTASGVTAAVSASYSGDSDDPASSGTFQVTVRVSVETTLVCDPATVDQGLTVLCSAHVTGSSPGGTASFSAPWGGGFFSPSGAVGSFTPDTGQCTVVSGNCNIFFYSLAPNTQLITAHYDGDSANSPGEVIGTLVSVLQYTDISVTCSPDPLPGDGTTTTTCTATASGAVPEFAITPTGTTTFSSDSPGGAFSPSNGECNLSSGTCSVTYTDTGTGTTTITANYPGDTISKASYGQVSLSVTPVTATSITCSPASVTVHYLSSTTCTVTVTGDGPIPTGTVTLSSSSSSASHAPSCTLVSGSCTFGYSNDTAGTDLITASYPGDADNAPGTGTYSMVVEKLPTTTSLSCSPSPVLPGSPVTCTVTTTGLYYTGTGPFVTTADFTSSSPTGNFSSDQCNVASGGGTCSVTYSDTVEGLATITASFPGDAVNTESSATFSVDVSGTFSITTSNGSTVCPGSLGGVWDGSTDTCSLTSGFSIPSGETLEIGAGVTVSGTSGLGGVVNDGTINNHGTLIGTNSVGYGIDNHAGGVINNAGTMTGNGSFAINNAAGGTINNAGTVTAAGGSYGLYNFGTINNNAAMHATGSAVGVVNAGAVDDYCGATTTYNTLSGAAPGSIACHTVTFDQSGLPAGATWGVTISWGPFVLPIGNSGTGSSIQVLAIGTLDYSYDSPVDGAGGATFDCTAGCTGSEAITSDASFSASYTNPDAVATTTTVTCALSAIGAGDSTTCDATVTGFSGAIAGETVTFSQTGGTGTISFPSGATCSLTAAGACDATVTIQGGDAGAITLQAYYPGDAASAASAGTFALTVTKAATTTSVLCSPSVASAGSSTTCTATVTGISPTGNVTFTSSSSGGTFVPVNGECTLSASSCSVTYTDGNVGSTIVTASYDGDSTNATSSGTFSFTVTKALSTNSVVCSPLQGPAGSAFTCTATIGGASPTGNVSFTSSSATGTFTPADGQCALSSGFCSVTYSDTTAGSPTLTASYAGDSNNVASSGTFDLTINTGAVISITTSTGSQVCPDSIGGSWDSATATCSAGSFTVQPGQTLEIGDGLSVLISGSITNQGTINNAGTITLGPGSGSLLNFGGSTINNVGEIELHGSGIGIQSGGAINNAGVITDQSSVGVYSYGSINNYCGGSLTYNSAVYLSPLPVTISCPTITFSQSGLPSGAAWGVSTSWSPTPGVTFLAIDHTGTGASITVSAKGSLSYSYDTPVPASPDETYACSTGCSRATTISADASFTASYVNASTPTSTAVTCDSSDVDAGLAATCTATVKGFAGSVEGETVTFSQSGGTGTVSFPSGATCTLAATGDCSTPVTVEGDVAGSVALDVSYVGDPINQASSGTTSLTIHPALSAGTVSALPNPVGVNQATTISTSGASGGSGSGTYTYAWTNLPPGCSSSDSDSISCTPTSNAGSPYNVQLEVTDSFGGTATATFSLIVAAPVIDTETGTSTTDTDTATATSGGVTSTATGTGSVTVSQYASNPGGAPAFSASGSYFDVYVSAGNTFSSLTTTTCDLNGGNAVFWWNGTDWVLVSPQIYDASTQCVTMTFDATSSPTLAELTGTPFGVGTTDEPPLVTVPADLSLEATGPDGAVVTFTSSAADAQDGPLPTTCNPASGSTFGLGDTEVTCSATDSSGLTGVASFTVSVVDTTPPIVLAPPDATVQANSLDGLVVHVLQPPLVVDDLVDPAPAVTNDAPAVLPLGTSVVTWFAEDGSGNIGSDTQSFTIICPPGTFQAPGSDQCTLAPAGSYVPVAGATAATLCAPGTYQPSAGQISCLPANPGSYVDTAGAIASTLCVAGFYQPDAGQTECIPAPAGAHVSAPGAASPTPCELGTFASGTGQVECDPAPPGSFVSVTGAIAPTLCVAGFYQPDAGQTECVPAPPGSYVSVVGATAATLCEPGTYQGSIGQTSCDQAPPGHYVPTFGYAVALPCEVGMYQPDQGQVTCVAAPIGHYVDTAGAAAPTLCEPGTFQALVGQTSCDPAPPGHFVPTFGYAVALPCAPGSYQPTAGQTTCLLALAGHFVSDAGQADQVVCPVGSFAASPGSVECEPAPPGSYVDSTGAVAPTLCEPGTFQPDFGATSCDPSPPGTYAPAEGLSAPIACAEGTYQPSAGQIECIAAPPGSFVADTGAVVATPCPVGTFQPGTGSTGCVPAPAGSYVASTGAVTPTPCAPGTFQALTGQSSCDPAPPGSFVDAVGAAETTPCEPGTFQPFAGQTECVQSPPGSSVDHFGATEPTLCDSGFYQPGFGAVLCFEAPIGTYVDTAGATEPIDCPPGLTTLSTGSTSLLDCVDVTPPELTIPADLIEEGNTLDGANVTLPAVTASDFIDPSPSVGCDAGDGFFPIGETIVTCTATDASGNSSSDSFTVTVVDTTPPALVVPTDLTVEGNETGGAVVTLPEATASDVVDPSPTVDCSIAGAIAVNLAIGLTTVHCTATDASGNVASQSFVVTVVDTTPPDLALPPDIVVEGDATGGAMVTLPAATATDIVDPAPEVICGLSSAVAIHIALGLTVVHCTSTDASGNSSSGSFTVTVVDTTPPTLDLPADLTVEGSEFGGATVDIPGATALDIVDEFPVVECVPLGQTFVPLGTTTVECTATDDAGNTSSGSFTVEVVDTTPPALALPGNITVEGIEPGGATVDILGATALDIVDEFPVVECLPLGQTFVPLGTTIVECTATDDAGNTSSGSFTVEVVDTTPPTLNIPANVLVEGNEFGGATIDVPGATALDIVDELPDVECLPLGQTFVPLGTTTVECTATDDAGNTSLGSFSVSVVDTTPPTLTVPDNITVQATGASGAQVTFFVAATDIVDPAPLVECVPPSGSTFPIGITTVQCSAQDLSGNLSFGTLTVTVEITIESLMSTVDDAVAAGTFVGEGPGRSGSGRLGSWLSMLDDASTLIDAGRINRACNQLSDAYLRADGEFPPPDFVAGADRAAIAELVRLLMGELGCDEPQVPGGGGDREDVDDEGEGDNRGRDREDDD